MFKEPGLASNTARVPRHTLVAFIMLGFALTVAAVVAIQPTIVNNEPAAPDEPAVLADSLPAIQAVSTCSSTSEWPRVEHDASYRPFTMRVITQNGAAVEGLCVTFLRDLLPSKPIQYVGACRTGQNGQCSLSVPVGLIRLYFSDTTIEGRSLNLSLNEIRLAGMGRTDNLAFMIDEDRTTADALLVVLPRGRSEVTIKSATVAADDSLTILNPDVPDWTQQRIER